MITLKNKKIGISVSPEMGMALIDFTVYNRSMLNKSLKNEFFKYRKGLGPIILPHFNQASAVNFEDIDKNDEKYIQFPHISYLQKEGIFHPFQHGIGRYVSWDYQVKKNTITGEISGNSKINNVSLKDLNGFDFKAKVTYTLLQNYLSILLQVSGEMPVASGIHFYYDSINEKSTISLKTYKGGNKTQLIFLNENHNDVLAPLADGNGFSHCLLKTERYNLLTEFMSKGNLNKVFESIIIFNDIKRNFVCIEPISYIVGTKNTKLNHCGEIRLTPNILI